MVVMLRQCFLYDLETSLFSFYIYISGIFSQSVVYIFVLLSVSHCKKKFLTFINYKYKSYIMVRSSGVLRNPCVPENHDDFLLFPPRSLIVLNFQFSPIMYFKLIFMYHIMWQLRLIFSTQISYIAILFVDFYFFIELSWCFVKNHLTFKNACVFLFSLCSSISLYFCQYLTILITTAF